MRNPQAVAAALGELHERFGGRVATGEAICRAHAHTLTGIAPEPPDAVVWAETTDDVSAIVAIASRHGVPIIPFGAGTSIEGHVNAPFGGISLDLSQMTQVLTVSPEDLDCTVEAGVTRRMLNAHLRDTGLMFPVDPGAGDATLGGMAATRASGTTTVRYGTMRDNVLSLKAVMADGSILTTGGRARKSAAGLDLTRLLVGSEGTLGIITELTLKLHPIPAHVVAVSAAFPSVQHACDATIEAGASGLGLSRVELLDALQMRAVNAHAKLGLPEMPHLFVEIVGHEAAVDGDLAAFREIALRNGATDFSSAGDHEARRRLWQARHDAFPAIQSTWPGKTTLVSDVAVPLSVLAACVAETVADLAASDLTAPIVGHVGDGNFHVIPVFDAEDSEEAAKVRAFLDRLVDRALRLGGTSTGEHGVGQGKIAYLEQELGAPAIAAMRAIKIALDPKGILNPGKMLA